MADTHFGFQMFWNNHDYFMVTDRKKVTNTMAELFAKEFFLHINRYSIWKNASEHDKAELLKRFKYAIQPCMFKITKTSTGVKHLSYTTLRHAQDENSGCGGGVIPEKYWENDVTMFWEDDLTEYFDEEKGEFV